MGSKQNTGKTGPTALRLAFYEHWFQRSRYLVVRSKIIGGAKTLSRFLLAHALYESLLSVRYLSQLVSGRGLESESLCHACSWAPLVPSVLTYGLCYLNLHDAHTAIFPFSTFDLM